MNDPMIEPRFLPLARFAEQAIPFHRHLGIQVYRLSAGDCTLHVPWNEYLIGDPQGSVVHGGVAPVLGNTAGGLACITAVESDSLVRTVDLRIEYLHTGHDRDLFCHASLSKLDGDMAHALITVSSGAPPGAGDGVILARGGGVYKIVRNGDKGRP